MVIVAHTFDVRESARQQASNKKQLKFIIQCDVHRNKQSDAPSMLDKKETITLTHIREATVYRCYCCRVDTFRWARRNALHFGIEFYPDLHIPFHLFCCVRNAHLLYKYALATENTHTLSAHRLTEQTQIHRTINTNETENNNCYYSDIICLRKRCSRRIRGRRSEWKKHLNVYNVFG